MYIYRTLREVLSYAQLG